MKLRLIRSGEVPPAPVPAPSVPVPAPSAAMAAIQAGAERLKEYIGRLHHRALDYQDQANKATGQARADLEDRAAKLYVERHDAECKLAGMRLAITLAVRAELDAALRANGYND